MMCLSQIVCACSNDAVGHLHMKERFSKEKKYHLCIKFSGDYTFCRSTVLLEVIKLLLVLL